MIKDFIIHNQAELNAAIRAISIGGASAAENGVYTITFAADLTDANKFNVDVAAINLASGSTLNIVGGGHTMDGADTYRGFFVLSGDVTINNLKIQNAIAQGGSGGDGLHAGGAGMGAGGGLFVNSGAKVTLVSVTFVDDQAVGGDGGRGATLGGAGGGGGMGGDGGASVGISFAANSFGGNQGEGGGGGLGLGATGGAGGAMGGGIGFAGGAGIAPGAASAGMGGGTGISADGGGAGGVNGGGGGGGNGGTAILHSGRGGGGGIGGTDGNAGGYGGDFGGGGGGGDTGETWGRGGFGGGGGGAAGGGERPGGGGGFGGGGGGALQAETVGSGGFGGGDGGASSRNAFGTYPGGGGGGGAGFGGALFVRDGGELILDNVRFSGGAVAGGQGGESGDPQGNGRPSRYGEEGQAAGTAMFLQGSGAFTYRVSVDLTLTDTIADEAGWVATTGYTPPAGFTPGSYTLVKTGLATLVLANANAYSGGTTIAAGTVDLATQWAAGTGAIDFGDPTAALRIAAAALDNNDFANTIGVFRVGHTINLRDIAGTGASVDAATDVLTILGTGTTLHLDPLATYGGFRITSDGNGGTNIVLVATITNPVGQPTSAAPIRLQGTGQAGNTVTMYDENHDVVGSATVAADGTFEVVTTRTFANGLHSFTATQTDPLSGLTSPPSDPFGVNVMPDAQFITEDGDVTFSSANGNTVVVFDLGSPTLEVTVSASHGGVTLGTLAGLRVTAGANGTGTITVSGGRSDIDAALDGLAYRPSADFNGSDTLAIVSRNGSHAVTNTVALSVAAVNDAPVVVKGTSAALTQLDEDGDPPGEQIHGLLVRHFSDAADDQPGGSTADALGAIAITSNAATGAEGVWQYFDGTWHDIGDAAVTQALVVDARHLIRFVPAANWNGAAPALTLHLIDDSGGALVSGSTADLTVTGGTTRYSVDTVALSATIRATNDPVTAGAPPDASVDEDGVVTLAMSISDPDATLAPDGIHAVTLSAGHGALTLGTTAGLSFAAGDGASDPTLTFHGTLADINAALASVGYAPRADYNGPDSVTLHVEDLSGGVVAAGSGTATSDDRIIMVTVNEVADVVDDNIMTDEDAPVTVNVITGQNGASADTFGAAPVLTGTTQGAHGSVTFSADGSVTYAPDRDYSGPDSFSYTVTSGGTTETGTVHVAIAGVNDAPVLADLGGSRPAYVENGTPVLLDADVAVGDVELDGSASRYAGATLTLRRQGGASAEDLFAGAGTLDLSHQNGGGENVSLDGGASFVGTFTQPGDGTFAITFNANADANAVAAVMRQIVYANTADNPPASVQIDYILDDGSMSGGQPQGSGPGTATGSVTVDIAPLDDAPVLSGVADAIYVAKTSGVALSPGIGIFDPDATLSMPTGLAGARVAIAGGLDAGDELFVALATNGSAFVTPAGAVTNIALQRNLLGVLELAGADTLAHYEAVLAAVSYRSTAADPIGDRTIAWQVNDGTLDSQTRETRLHVDRLPVLGLDPANAGGGFLTSYTENSAAIAIADSGIAIADPDSATLDAAVITLTNAKPFDALSVDGPLPGGIGFALDTSVPGMITLRLFNAASLADYQAAIALVRFANTSDAPDVADRDITVMVSAGSAQSNVAHATVHVLGVNDAPVNAVPGTQEIEANRPTAIAGLAVADPDAGIGAISATLSVEHGTLKVAALGGAAVSGSGTPSVTIGGTLAAINATLGTVVYAGERDYFGTDTLRMVASDGSALTDTDSVTINLNTHLAGTPGDDMFIALPGNARIDALGGSDAIRFDFRLTDATITWSGNRVIIDGPSSHTVLTGFETYEFADGTVRQRDGAPLVDDLYYYAQYHDVWNARADADQHYHQFGRHEGRDPSAFFDTATYLTANPDVAAAGIDPLVHFHEAGWREGRIPSIAFDPMRYLDAYPDVSAAGVDPLAHFLQFGAQEGRQPFAPSALVAPNGFDYAYYLAHNADVAVAGIDAFTHFQTFGWKEGRDPNAQFDTSGYLAAYADVAGAGINPLEHYHQHGWREGRDPSVAFDTSDYLAHHPDVAASGADPLLHYLQHGMHEGRSAFADGVWG